MGRPKGKKKEQSIAENSNNEKDEAGTSPVGENIELPGQEHCTWLLNVIRLHAKEISTEQLKEFEQNQVSNLTHQLENLKKELQLVKAVVEDIEYLKSVNVKQQRKIERLEYENTKRQSEIHDLKMKLDAVQQKDLEKCIQIVGLPEASNDSDDVKQVTKLAKDKLGVKLKSSDVKMQHLGKKKNSKTRNVIIELKDKQTRENIYNQRKKLIKPGNVNRSIYLNDSLTIHRQQLLFAARKLVKSKKIYAAWSQQGNILVRKKENSRNHS